jgi:hypothetical protein
MRTIIILVAGLAFLSYLVMRIYGYCRWGVLRAAIRLVETETAISHVIGGERLISWANSMVRVQCVEPLDPEFSGLPNELCVTWGGGRALYGKQHELTWKFGDILTFMRYGVSCNRKPWSATHYLKKLADVVQARMGQMAVVL